MGEADIVRVVALPIGLGLLGFIEPCSIGSTLLFVKSLEEHEASRKLRQVGAFTAVRALFMGTLGLAAAAAGSVFLGFQKAARSVFGVVYLLIGIAYVIGKSGLIARCFGPSLSRLSSVKGAAALGALFAFNIPACAAPFVLALVGVAAAGAASGSSLTMGFVELSLFGLALSLPIVVLTLFPHTQNAFDWLAGLSRRMPMFTGIVLIGLGLWSIWFGVFVSIGPRA